ncbi:hypothetical protein, partial [Limosilactobacillus reuteri]|uniref:hypothetical protein n=1 Tax=Limosilactobacillus reuteri TaxID=1598 RepID=UPI001E5F13F5
MTSVHKKIIVLKNSINKNDQGAQLLNLGHFFGYTLSGMDRDSMPDFFIQKRGHLLSPRYTINSP